MVKFIFIRKKMMVGKHHVFSVYIIAIIWINLHPFDFTADYVDLSELLLYLSPLDIGLIWVRSDVPRLVIKKEYKPKVYL